MGTPTVGWDLTFEGTPAGGDDPRQADDRMREIKVATRERYEREHVVATSETTSYHGYHRTGTARASYASSDPTTTPDGTTTRALDTTYDIGRLHVDSVSKVLKVYTGSGWSLCSALPVGCMMFFSGTFTDNSTIPGWYACDGTDGTPNLTQKFIRCNTTSGGSGGSSTISTSNMPSHTHSVGTLAVGSHTHSFSGTTDAGGNAQYTTDTIYHASDSSRSTADSGSHTHTFSGVTGGTAPTISGATASSGSGTAYWPPYWDLIPIMRMV